MKFLYTIMILCTLTISKSVSQSLIVKDFLQCQANAIHSDLLGNLYIVKNQYFIKYDTSGNVIAQYSNLRLGDIATADVSNYQKIFLFYNESGYFVILNDNLSEISTPINLNQYISGIYTLACPSYNQGFWCYHQIDKQLIRLDKYFNKTNESIYLTDIDQSFNPTQLFEVSEKWVVLYDPKGILCFFDKFGTLVKKLQIASSNHIQISENLIFYLKDNLLHVYNYQNLEEKTYMVPIPDMLQVVFNQHGFYVLNQKGDIFKVALHP